MSRTWFYYLPPLPRVAELERVRHPHLLLPVELGLDERLARERGDHDLVVDQYGGELDAEGRVLVEAAGELEGVVHVADRRLRAGRRAQRPGELDGLVGEQSDGTQERRNRSLPGWVQSTHPACVR